MRRNPFGQMLETARQEAARDARAGQLPAAGAQNATIMVEGPSVGEFRAPGRLDVTLISEFRLASGQAGAARGEA